MVAHIPASSTSWQGRSGRSYWLCDENLENFVMSDDRLYLIARDGHALWVGSTAELVSDPASRARFRHAMSRADRIFYVVTPGAMEERLSTIFDLEGAALSPERSAA